jgi:hypothetical protein
MTPDARYSRMPGGGIGRLFGLPEGMSGVLSQDTIV